MISRGIGSVESFRPLSGSYISQFCLKTVVCCFFRFRPLSGSYISQSDSSNCNFYGFSVSVPYRGATFLNRIRSPDLFLTSVSVPYRGATFLNQFYLFYWHKDYSFPSPIGELHFSMMIWKYRTYLFTFPSPIGELHFSIFLIVTFGNLDLSFRPLSGSYISQSWKTIN